MSRSTFSSRDGMSLIEVMISLSVISVGLMAMFGAMGTAHDVATTTANRERLKTVIQVESEIIQAQVQAHGVEVLTDTFLRDMCIANVAGLTPVGTTPVITVAATPSTDPSYLTGSSATNFKAVTFTATWQGGTFKRAYYYAKRA